MNMIRMIDNGIWWISFMMRERDRQTDRELVKSKMVQMKRNSNSQFVIYRLQTDLVKKIKAKIMRKNKTRETRGE